MTGHPRLNCNFCSRSGTDGGRHDVYKEKQCDDYTIKKNTKKYSYINIILEDQITMLERSK